MRSMIGLTPALLLFSMILPCHAGTTSTIKVSAQIVHSCTASAEQPTDCSPETLQFQSTLSGSASIVTDGDQPAVEFIGPQPVIEQRDNTFSVMF